MEYVYSVLILVGINIIMASSFNLIIGYGGLISIAHPIFFALAGYCSAIISMQFGVPIPLAIIAGTLFSTLLSVALSLPSLRVSGDYLLIASIGFQLGFVEVIKNIEAAGAASGLTGIPPLFSGPLRSPAFVVTIFIVAALVVWLVHRMTHGDYGRAIQAMRDDEECFLSLGRNATAIKAAIFAVGSGIAGLAGALYAHYSQFLSPEQFGIIQSGLILTMVVVGGMGTTWGPVVGALLLTALPQAITFLNLPTSIMAPLQGMLYTGLVLIFLFLRPAGLVGRKAQQ
ncbi:MAG: branched-chain amino acid ABC transporter permease [Candidatus Parcubacteria bacterium]|nr:branched-chain amino acid ABC transporter permease [Burkholderiales bacterium]